ncbi:MAG: hypothetical protein QG670_2282 [Thermoproteota archaeon]|nr:hypothetical protein [Thermoproteota archaeon]
MKDEDSQRIVEEGLGSVGRLKILRALAKGNAISETKYSLEKVTGLKPIDVRKHLKILIDTSWVREYDYNPPVYTLNKENPKVKLLMDFFKSVDYL